ncbi:MAG: TolC family protein, partial [Bacteroidales bacterium]|nr:TolC family protein [Bacteroidales bacterium]
MKTITSIRNMAALVALAVALPAAVSGQSLDYNTFINRVMRNNLEYAVAQLDRSVSEADLKAALKFTDPTFSAEYGNNSDWDIMMGQSLSFELGKTISFGKRSV